MDLECIRVGVIHELKVSEVLFNILGILSTWGMGTAQAKKLCRGQPLSCGMSKQAARG